MTGPAADHVHRLQAFALQAVAGLRSPSPVPTTLLEMIAVAIFAFIVLHGADQALAGEFVGKDGVPMVLIPEGAFLRGSAPGEGDGDEQPQRNIHLSAFYIDRFEVTNRRYQAFLKATNHRTPEHCCDFSYNVWKGTEFPPALSDHPVLNVDWFDAEAYCKWAGKRLPTEAEWEKAARGAEARVYPWGNTWDRTRVNSAPYWAGKDFSTSEDAKAWWGDGGVEVIGKKGFQGMLTLPVTVLEQGATPTGLMHMAGNVWEWVADWYDQAYYATSPDRNPRGHESGEYKVTRGGSWLNHQHLLRTTARAHPCATTAPASAAPKTRNFSYCENLSETGDGGRRTSAAWTVKATPSP